MVVPMFYAAVAIDKTNRDQFRPGHGEGTFVTQALAFLNEMWSIEFNAWIINAGF
jgi:hypothetical protein